jgi:hypothetical protein
MLVYVIRYFYKETRGTNCLKSILGCTRDLYAFQMDKNSTSSLGALSKYYDLVNISDSEEEDVGIDVAPQSLKTKKDKEEEEVGIEDGVGEDNIQL